MQIYIVKNGDSVNKIASEYSVDVDRLINVNQLIYPYELAIGQALLIDSGEDNDQDSLEIRSIQVNGFAYPYISRWVLNETLPYLTELSVFSYGFTEQGELIPPILEDQFLVDSAINYNVKPILTLTPFSTDGKFNNTLISIIVNDEAVQEVLINNVFTTMSAKGYTGVNIDFEFILAEDRDKFTAFVSNVVTRALDYGYEVSVDLAPKNSSSQQGLLYEGKDYRGLGQIADNVLVMTYEWGYTYGPPMAVAPINQVRRVIEYAVTEIEPSKINLGIPNYGYDWPLPYERGVTRARTVGNVEAIRIAIENGAEIKFDETAMSPYFTYENQGIEHVVWFEDVRSMEAKFNLIKEFSLRGAGYWQIMQLFRANWVLLADKFTLGKI